MKTRLLIDNPAYQRLMSHLLPHPESGREQAAFLFASEKRRAGEAIFDVVEIRRLQGGDFAAQSGDYIELTDEVRGGLIKRAHDLGTSLVEIHSHLGPWPAAFSLADRAGLRETVPHMWWRLDRKPYLALVVTKTDFDALIWLNNSNVPQALDAWQTGTQTRTPTNISLGGWRWTA